jgi:hypothetical protein
MTLRTPDDEDEPCTFTFQLLWNIDERAKLPLEGFNLAWLNESQLGRGLPKFWRGCPFVYVRSIHRRALHTTIYLFRDVYHLVPCA